MGDRFSATIPSVILADSALSAYSPTSSSSTLPSLRATGLQAFCHRSVPPNDGGLAAGQLAFAAHPLAQETG